MAQEPTFLFCVGATKAGTSWLHSHLAAHDECHFRSIKELHYFGLTRPAQFGTALRAGRAEIARLGAMALQRGDASPAIATRITDLRDWQRVLRLKVQDLAAYRAYLTADRGTAHVVGDMTPAYALLPEATLHHLQTVGNDVRLIYLLRDPLSRLWSHVRMLARHTSPQKFVEAAQSLLGRILDADPSPDVKGIVARGDYQLIVPKLTKVFDANRMLIMFYEDMLSSGGVATLSRFLSIAPGKADFERKVHRGAPLDLSPEMRDRALAFLRPQYDFVARCFSDLPTAWRMNMNEGCV